MTLTALPPPVLSLRSFHLFFIAASIALGLLLGVWGLRQYSATGALGPLGLGLLFLAVAVVLAIYRRRFARQTRGLDDE